MAICKVKNIFLVSNRVNTMEEIMENTIRDNYWDIADYSDTTGHSLLSKSDLYIHSCCGIRGNSRCIRTFENGSMVRYNDRYSHHIGRATIS